MLTGHKHNKSFSIHVTPTASSLIITDAKCHSNQLIQC